LSDHEFVFALEMSADPASDRMLDQLAATVLGHVGFAAPVIAELTAALHGALANGAAHGQPRCDVRFVAHAGALQIVVARAGAAEWRTTRPLP
jgi:hypothetical protein